MTRKLVIICILALGAALTALLIGGSFVAYAQPISAADMQNIYLQRMIWFGVPILLLQLLAAALVLTDRKSGDAT